MIIKGKIEENSAFDYYYLTVDGEDVMRLLLEYLELDYFDGGEVLVKSLRYAISENPIESIDSVLLDIENAFDDETLDMQYIHRYSEETGYLWTDEKLEIGGHDILKELYSYIGKYLYLEIIRSGVEKE